MPRTPSFLHHRVHEHRATPYHLDSLRVPPASTYISSGTPSPTGTLVNRSYPSSSAATSPSPSRRDLSPSSPFDTPIKPKHNAFAADGELYPYVKGKKVSNAQLAQLLDWFREEENPTKDVRVIMANQLQMSFKALSIWFQNERANVKKGRARAAPKPPTLAKLPPPTFISTRRPSPGQYRGSSWSHHSDTDEEDELETPVYDETPLPEVRVESAEELDEEGIYVATILASLKRS